MIIISIIFVKLHILSAYTYNILKTILKKIQIYSNKYNRK